MSKTRTLIEYRLFSIGRIVFFQILDQAEIITNRDDSGRFFCHTTELMDGEYTIYSSGCVSLCQFRSKILYLRGYRKDMDMNRCEMRCLNEGDAISQVSIINHCIANYIHHYCKMEYRIKQTNTTVKFYEI